MVQYVKVLEGQVVSSTFQHWPYRRLERRSRARFLG